MSNSALTFGDSNEFPEAPAWKPEPGDTLFMEIGSLDEYDSDYSPDPTTVYEGVVLDGETSTHRGEVIEPGTEIRVFLFGAFLSRDAKKNALGSGDKVAFKRYEDAKESTKSGYAPAKRYKTKVLSRVTAAPAPAATKEEDNRAEVAAAAEAKVEADRAAAEERGVGQLTPSDPPQPNANAPAIPVEDPAF